MQQQNIFPNNTQNNNVPQYDPQTETRTHFASRLISAGLPLDEVLKIMEKIGFTSFSDVIKEYLAAKKVTVTNLMDTLEMSTATFYKYTQLDNKKHRNPSRNVILKMALALQLSFDETQLLLKSAGRAGLTGTSQRDIIIMNAIINTNKAANNNDGTDYFDLINDELTAKNLPDLNGDHPEDKG
ncbi:MAG: hypothetical protein IJU48_05050 [Synergistaceae bacterium]|nr:hypothetical protein [Synergistaceae bacterium]